MTILQFFYQESVTLAGSSATDEVVGRLEAERVQLYGDLQRCMYEIQQRDQFFQQLNTKVKAETTLTSTKMWLKRFSDARLKTLVYFIKNCLCLISPHTLSHPSLPAATTNCGGEKCLCSSAESCFPNTEGHTEPLPLVRKPSPSPGSGEEVCFFPRSVKI